MYHKGVNIGSWMVLEPWITPSLFYQFIGKTVENTAMDMYSFCRVLGPQEANRQLLQHWNSWFTEEDVLQLKKYSVTTVRIPVGDWIFEPYGVYDIYENGVRCTDGSIDILNKMLQILEKHNIFVLLDLHATIGSQNGYDNSGHSKKIVVIDEYHFSHWNVREAQWVGTYNTTSKCYDTIDYTHINYTKRVLENIFVKYFDMPYVWGIELLNEPWEYTPEKVLKTFYEDIYNFVVTNFDVKGKALILHDSFRPLLWKDFKFHSTSELSVYIDLHFYMAWNYPMNIDTFLSNMESWTPPHSYYPYIIGEWSVATDNCQMWLNGFMDNLPNYPMVECNYEVCNHANTSVFLNVEKGPFGTGNSSPTKDGMCPTSFSNHQEKDLYMSLSHIFRTHTKGDFFWNFKTESSNLQWNYCTIQDSLLQTHTYTYTKYWIGTSVLFTSILMMF